MRYIPLYFFLLGLIACSDKDIEMSPNGVEIQFLKRGEGPELEIGKILMMHTSYSTENGYIIMESLADNPLALYNDQNPIEKGGLLKDVINQLRIGDSVYFEIPAENLFEVSFQIATPDTIERKSKIKFNLAIVDQLDEVEYRAFMMDMDIQKNQSKYDKELDLLDSLLKSQNIDHQKHESGIRYVIESEGTGMRALKGDTVKVKYEGSTLADEVFDSGEYIFTFGEGEVIQGWDIGIGLFDKGAKGILYIPSKYGYGSRGAARPIEPYTTLKFKIEILEINEGDK